MKTFDPQANVTTLRELCHPNEKRNAARLRQEGVESTLGTVVDLSLTGMRVIARGIPSEAVDVRISTPEEQVFLRVEVAWSKRIGFRRREVGLRFLDVTDDQKAILQRIAYTCRDRRLLVD